LEDLRICEMGREQSQNLVFCAELVLLTHSRVRVAGDHAAWAQAILEGCEDLSDLRIAETVQRSVPDDGIEGARRKPVADIGNEIGDVRCTVEGLGVGEDLGVEVDGRDRPRASALEELGEETITATELEHRCVLLD